MKGVSLKHVLNIKISCTLKAVKLASEKLYTIKFNISSKGIMPETFGFNLI